MYKYFLILFISLLPSLCPAGTLPFQDNERLKFRIRWSFIPAGEVTLEIAPQTEIDNQRARHFILTATTYQAVDLLYKFRERIDSYVDTGITHSLLYKKNQTGKRTRDEEVVFDWQKNQVQFTNFGEPLKPIALVPGTLDPLSALYRLRLMDFTTDKPLQRPITDGKRIVDGQARIIRREKIDVLGTSYDTFLLEPDMKDVKGVFEKSKDAKMFIWVTADERRMLVKLKSKVVVGSFVAELVEHNYPTSGVKQ
jgi:hypothetical protein